MNLVLMKSEEEEYWNDENLVDCFIDALKNLQDGLERKTIPDIFFPDVST